MTMLISELYEALIDAGASEEKAKEAAEALSAEDLSSKNNITEVKEELARLDKKMAVRHDAGGCCRYISACRSHPG